MVTEQLENAIVKYYGIRKYIILPNVYWGLGFRYELDLLIVSKSYVTTEIELKISKSDILAEKNKRWFAHESNRIKNFYYAVPENLKDFALKNISTTAGLYIVDNKFNVTKFKKCIPNKHYIKFNQNEINKIGHLALMRYWNLKLKIYKDKTNES